MHRRALVRGSLALGIAPILGKSLNAFAYDATPTAATPVLPVTVTDGSGTEGLETPVDDLPDAALMLAAVLTRRVKSPATIAMMPAEIATNDAALAY